MMTVEPTCRFCQRRLVQLTPFQSRGQTVYSCHCIHCRSEQIFEKDGKPLEYSFRVGDYLCQFNLPQGPKFQVVHDSPEQPFPVRRKLVLTLDFYPHNLRPDNTTEERIKTLILFS